MISVIVPLFNEGETVSTLVAHLQELEGLDEAILVDASSQSDSRKVIDALKKNCSPNILIIQSQQCGRAVQMNLGADWARGDVLLFLHCDSRLPQDALLWVQCAMDSGCSWGRFDIRLDAEGIMFRVIESMINLRSRMRRLATGDQGIFVNTNVFRQCGGYPAITLMEDIAISNQLNSFSRPFLIKKPLITSARRWRNCGVLSTVALMWKLRFLYWIGVSPAKLYQMYGDER